MKKDFSFPNILEIKQDGKMDLEEQKKDEDLENEAVESLENIQASDKESS